MCIFFYCMSEYVLVIPLYPEVLFFLKGMKLPGCITYKNHEIIIFLNYFLEGLGFMVFNATFNNISVISWRSVLLVEEAGVSGENYRPSASH